MFLYMLLRVDEHFFLEKSLNYSCSNIVFRGLTYELFSSLVRFLRTAKVYRSQKT